MVAVIYCCKLAASEWVVILISILNKVVSAWFISLCNGIGVIRVGISYTTHIGLELSSGLGHIRMRHYAKNMFF